MTALGGTPFPRKKAQNVFKCKISHTIQYKNTVNSIAHLSIHGMLIFGHVNDFSLDLTEICSRCIPNVKYPRNSHRKTR